MFYESEVDCRLHISRVNSRIYKERFHRRHNFWPRLILWHSLFYSVLYHFSIFGHDCRIQNGHVVYLLILPEWLIRDAHQVNCRTMKTRLSLATWITSVQGYSCWTPRYGSLVLQTMQESYMLHTTGRTLNHWWTSMKQGSTACNQSLGPEREADSSRSWASSNMQRQCTRI